MKRSFTLGRIAGIEVGMNWSVLVIALLVTLGLGGTLLPLQVPGYSTGAYLVAGLIGAAGLLAAILVHELGHAIVARRHGVEVEGITLWLFGGVASLEGDTPDPKAELKIAGVGPALSLALAGGLWAVSGIVGTAAGALAGGVVGWLAFINLVLGVFNLLPGAPLDGGRILHAVLWWRSGDRAKATAKASAAGRLVGFGLMAVGAVQFLYAGFTGLWTAMIGWFLAGAATAEQRQSEMLDSLRGITVRDVMVPVTQRAPDWLVVDEFVARVVAPRPASVYVLEGFDGVTSGVVTVDDLGRLDAEARRATPVRAVARPVAEAAQADPATSVTKLLRDTDWTRTGLAVVRYQGMTVGVLTKTVLQAALQRARLLKSVRDRFGPQPHDNVYPI